VHGSLARRRVTLALAVVAVVVACSAQAGAAPLADGKITGRVASALRPGRGAQAIAQAIDASNLMVAATGKVTKAGTYKVSVPPGVYLVGVDRLGWRTPPATGYSRLVRVKDGRTVSPPQITRRPQDAAGVALYEGKPVVAVKKLTASGPGAQEFRVGTGFAQMLSSEMAANPCIAVTEWIRRSEVLDEIRLQQRAGFDPSTRVTPGRLLQPDVFVEGSISLGQSSFSWNIRIRNAKTGRVVASDRGSASGDDYFNVTAGIAERLLEQLGATCLPPRFEGTFSGELVVSGKTSFTGKIRFDRIDPPPDKGVATYRVSRVEFTTTIDGRPACQGTATEKVTLTDVDRNTSQLVIDPHRIKGKGYQYFVVSLFQSPRQRQVTFTCNGVSTSFPWVPAAALNTGSSNYTNGTKLKGRNAEMAPSVYVWDLDGSG
jgi:hypothetical protein